ncbi:molybdate transporter 1-like [Forsythia ovata]|uniref:Molybdate transporter 1-like n=1 Tax=Forsythia ovata TaxID=205694 RepID=A0ABD1RHH1_9LAMI
MKLKSCVENKFDTYEIYIAMQERVLRVTSYEDLFPEKNVSTTSVFGIMNLIGCWFGATSCCHSAEGIAGQYKFGGMSGWCVALLGIAKLVLGLGSSLVKILDQFLVGFLESCLNAGVSIWMICLMNFYRDDTVS